MQQFKNERKPRVAWSATPYHDRKSRFAQALRRSGLIAPVVLMLLVLPSVDVTAATQGSSAGTTAPSATCVFGSASAQCATQPLTGAVMAHRAHDAASYEALSIAERIWRGAMIVSALAALVISRCLSLNPRRHAT